MATTKLTDIRETLPLAVKGGTSSRPVWEIDGNKFAFVRPTNVKGRGPDDAAIRLGKRQLAKYVAGTTKSGKDLVFVGLFKAADAE